MGCPGAFAPKEGAGQPLTRLPLSGLFVAHPTDRQGYALLATWPRTGESLGCDGFSTGPTAACARRHRCPWPSRWAFGWFNPIRGASEVQPYGCAERRLL